jgi:hypothetical protein
MVASQPVGGVEIIGLGEHVDYWDRLGWRDPFSSAVFTKRQADYDARVFGSDRSYTPQLVADGQFECVGSDRAAVRGAVLAAARRPKAAVTIETGRAADGVADVAIGADLAAIGKRRDQADVFIAVTEDRLVSHVRRGENGGRTLTHDAVVRVLATAGSIPSTEPRFAISTRVAIDPAWDSAALRIVAFVQERQSLRILGGSASRLAPSLAPGRVVTMPGGPGQAAVSHDGLSSVYASIREFPREHDLRPNPSW